ncbi:hypothetical protein EHI47_07310 [Rhizobium leguminosarum]|uniref:peptide-methionine (S)-S-oxide reductase n=1 Tax=Rhizobium leguminosarum TaxID=384 RepID=A0A444I7E4_RHILE|nr:peptide-methionine (S)-S-oxide reductase [Rhizobium leguminosarum]RWX34199.1 hypothetical protein EHI47_07310 [Rhizobium leguminosarum]
MTIGTIGARFRRGSTSLCLQPSVSPAGSARWPSDSTAPSARLLRAPRADAANKSPVGCGFCRGCFWGSQDVSQHVQGVATASYAGGAEETATYEATETRQTDHAEAVRIIFDLAQITYGDLLRIFSSAAKNPRPSVSE